MDFIFEYLALYNFDIYSHFYLKANNLKKNMITSYSEKEKFSLEDFTEDSRIIIEDYICSLCRMISPWPIILGKLFIPNIKLYIRSMKKKYFAINFMWIKKHYE